MCATAQVGTKSNGIFSYARNAMLSPAHEILKMSISSISRALLFAQSLLSCGCASAKLVLCRASRERPSYSSRKFDSLTTARCACMYILRIKYTCNGWQCELFEHSACAMWLKVWEQIHRKRCHNYAKNVAQLRDFQTSL